MRLAKLNESVPLFLQLDKNDNSQYPSAIIMNAAGTVVGTVNLNVVGSVDGKYLGTFTFTSLGDYSIKYVVYSDVGRTIVNNAYRFADETIHVSDLEQNVEDLLTGNIGNPVAVFD